MTFFRITILTIVFAIMIALTGVNLTFSNTIGETCGVIHPYIFQTQVSVIDSVTGRDWSSTSNLPRGVDEDFDTYLRIYDEQGNLLEQNDDFNGREAGIVDFRVSESQAIIVEVATFDDGFGGFYKLEVKDTPENLSAIYPELRINSPISGEIRANNRNRYTLSVAVEQDVSISVSGTDAQGFVLDTYLRVYNSANQMIYQNDDYDGVNAGVEYLGLLDNDTVIIEVGTYNDALEGTYNILVEPYIFDEIEEQTIDEVDDIDSSISSNLSILEGANISIGESLTHDIALESRVRHSLDLEANQYVDILLAGELDTYLRIYDETGQLVAQNDDFDGLNSGIVALGFAEDSHISIEVGTFDDFAEGQYELIVSESRLQIIQGSEIVIDSPVSAELMPDSRVRHSLTLQAGQLLNISLRGDLDTYLRIYDATGQLIAQSDDFDGANAGFANFSRNEDSTLIIEVATFSDSQAGQYELLIEESNLQFIDNAPAIEIGRPFLGDAVPDYRIRYPLDLTAGQAVTISLNDAETQVEPLHHYLRLYDDAGRIITESYNSEEFNAVISRFEAYDDMSLIVEVSTYNDSGEGLYQLSVEEFQLDIVASDEIEVGATVSNSIEEGQRFQYPLFLEAGQAVIIFLNGELDTYLRIYDESGNLLEQNDDLSGVNAGVVGFSVETASWVTIEAGTFGDSQTGNYELLVEPYSLELLQEFLDIEIANRAEIGLDETIAGEIIYGQRIHHALNIRANQLVNIFLSGEHSEGYLLDTYLRIYDQSGNILAQNDDFEGLSSGLMSFSVENDMTVIIEVASFSDSATGQYELFVQANNLQIVNNGSVEIGDIVTGNIKPEQRFRYMINLEAERSISILLRRDDAREGLNLSEILGNSADEWVSCLEYYGYIVDSAYVINDDGLGEFVYGSKLEELCDLQSAECDSSAQITLTPLGQFLFYVILPGLAIILPIITVFMLKGDWEALWFVSLILVAMYVLTSALLYVHLGTVSGIVALSEFAYGMFGGTATGAAIAFMTKVMDNFSIDRSEDKDEQAKAILELIEKKLRDSSED